MINPNVVGIPLRDFRVPVPISRCKKIRKCAGATFLSAVLLAIILWVPFSFLMQMDYFSPQMEIAEAHADTLEQNSECGFNICNTSALFGGALAAYYQTMARPTINGEQNGNRGQMALHAMTLLGLVLCVLAFVSLCTHKDMLWVVGIMSCCVASLSVYVLWKDALEPTWADVFREYEDSEEQEGVDILATYDSKSDSETSNTSEPRDGENCFVCQSELRLGTQDHVILGCHCGGTLHAKCCTQKWQDVISRGGCPVCRQGTGGRSTLYRPSIIQGPKLNVPRVGELDNSVSNSEGREPSMTDSQLSCPPQLDDAQRGCRTEVLVLEPKQAGAELN